MPKVELNAVKEAIGNTWFTLESEPDDTEYVFSSRVYGNVGDETAGRQDIEEGRRILLKLRVSFPEAKVTGEVVDEWVMVTIASD